MKKAAFLIFVLILTLFTIEQIECQVYEIDQILLNKILLFRGETISGEYRYESDPDSKIGELNKLNNTSGVNCGVIIKANLSICTDGAPDDIQEHCTSSDKQCVDQNHLCETAHTIKGKSLNADKIAYLVLPGDERPRPYLNWGLSKGDIGVIINMDNNENKLIFAIFGEVSPNELIGEASIYASKQLGHCPCNGTSENLSSIDDNVYYLVFKNTKQELIDMKINQSNLNQKVTELGLKKFKQLLGIEIR